MRCGIDFTTNMGILPTVIESDALNVVNLIKLGGHCYADIGLVYKDIGDRILSGDIFRVEYVPREANVVAHTLAKHCLLLRTYFGLRVSHLVWTSAGKTGRPVLRNGPGWAQPVKETGWAGGWGGWARLVLAPWEASLLRP
ncbi:hypothetical protein Q3G72_002913 [Acer saccharum]|nr:hypothetical protein Q3G72_002913 [Acer saccharum]